MDILLLCGYFEPQYQSEILRKTKTGVENAANTFQQRLIAGLEEQLINLTVVSAPFIGPWPTAYRDIWFNRFEGEASKESVTYVGFNNLWGYRNISRAAALKKQVRRFIEDSKDAKKAIIVYSPHTPFLEAAVYGKQIDSTVHIHMVVPDLPWYMNLSKKKHPIYDFFKKIDIEKFMKLNENVDSYMLLTKHMADALHVGRRPYIVVEGIVDKVEIPKPKSKRGKTIAYAGKLNESFGVKRLIEAFEMIDDSEARLEICGGGELKDYVLEMVKKDDRIIYHGMVSAEESRRILQDADVLVNPRQNNEEYTKYSFPSKNIEYLLTGNTVVAYMLDGMPEIYERLLVVPSGESIEQLANSINRAMEESKMHDIKRYEETFNYLRNNCVSYQVAEEIVCLTKDC